MQPKITFNTSGNNFSSNQANLTSGYIASQPAHHSTTINTTNPATYNYDTQNINRVSTNNYAAGNTATFTTGSNAAYNSVNRIQSANYAHHNTVGYTEPITTTEVRQVVPVTENYEQVRRVQSHPMQISEVRRVEGQTAVANHEIIEEYDRPHFNKIHASHSYRHDRQIADNTKRQPKSTCCSPCCWALWGLLGLIGVVLGMLFGLGVIGGLNGPDLGIHAPGIDGNIDGNIDGGKDNGGVVDVEQGQFQFGGAKYSSSSVTVDTKIINKTQSTEGGSSGQIEVPHTQYQFPPSQKDKGVITTTTTTVITDSDGVKPVEVKPIAVKPIAVQPIAVKPISVKPVEAKPTEVKPVEVQPSVKPIAIQPVNVEPVNVEPVKVEPVKVESTNVKPVSVHPVQTSIKPVSSSETVSVNPISVEPISVKPISVSPKTTETVAVDSQQPILKIRTQEQV